MHRKRGRICCAKSSYYDHGQRIDIACRHAPWHLFLTIELVIILESLTLRPLIYSDLRVQIASLIELIVGLMTESIDIMAAVALGFTYKLTAV